MADETPEQIRERVHAEELAKGSDPRVAEGRAKAAELRARQGLPIEPDAAWRKKLEMEGGPVSVSATAEPTEAVSEAVAPPEEAEPAVSVAEPESAPEPEEPPEPEPAPASPVAVATAESPPAAALDQKEIVFQPAPVSVPPVREAAFEPEVGQLVESDAETFEELAGIKLRDAILPRWLLVALLVIPFLAAIYVVVLAGAEDFGTGCRVEGDRTLTCFIAPETPGEP